MVQGDKILTTKDFITQEIKHEIADALGVSEKWVRETRHALVKGGQIRSNPDLATQEVKREITADYIDEYGVHETDQEIADSLGVSEQWVQKVRMSMVQDDQIPTDSDLATQEIKREITAEYIQDHPDKSDREVAENTSVGRTTVGKIRKEIEDETLDFEGPKEKVMAERVSDDEYGVHDDLRNPRSMMCLMRSAKSHKMWQSVWTMGRRTNLQKYECFDGNCYSPLARMNTRTRSPEENQNDTQTNKPRRPG